MSNSNLIEIITKAIANSENRMHTNESYGKQRMQAESVLEALKTNGYVVVRESSSRSLEDDMAYKDHVFDTLRREILAARVKVTLDKELGRPTSETVFRLAGMKLPPIARRRF